MEKIYNQLIDETKSANNSCSCIKSLFFLAYFNSTLLFLIAVDFTTIEEFFCMNLKKSVQ